MTATDKTTTNKPISKKTITKKLITKKTTANKAAGDYFNLKNEKKLNKNFMYKDLKRSNCYDCDFSGSNFDFTSLRGAHFKSCNFFECTFKAAEFVGTNFKKSKFKKARFENTLFDSVNLEGADFRGAEFKNTIFLFTDVSKAVNLELKDGEIRVYQEMPKVEMSSQLEHAVKTAMENKFIKASRVLDTKEGKMNPLSVMILLENFDEETLVKGMNLFTKKIDKSFHTLSYVIKAIQGYKSEGMF